MRSERVGLFGGTFNPIHWGHLNLAIELKERRDLDEVWFCPASLNPLRTSDSHVSAQDRLTMVSLALEGIPGFKVLDVELRRGGPSYTIETVRWLLDRERDQPRPKQFFLIVGDDAIDTLARWRQVEQLVELIPMLVGTRTADTLGKPGFLPPKVAEAVRQGRTATPVMEVSGTVIRARLAGGLYCGHLMPATVLSYITSHGLYRTDPSGAKG